eukprot:4272384-Pleurochrysis_carterae.AAC.1
MYHMYPGTVKRILGQSPDRFGAAAARCRRAGGPPRNQAAAARRRKQGSFDAASICQVAQTSSTRIVMLTTIIPCASPVSRVRFTLPACWPSRKRKQPREQTVNRLLASQKITIGII